MTIGKPTACSHLSLLCSETGEHIFITNTSSSLFHKQPRHHDNYNQNATKNKAGTASNASRARGALDVDKEAPE